MLKSLLIFIFILSSFIVQAEVWVYQYPGERIQVSPFYKVNVRQEGEIFQSLVYYSHADFGDLTRSSSWSTFSFSEKITIEVEVLLEPIKECVVRPKSKNIKYEIEGNHIRFELLKPQKLVVEINGNKKKPLFIFADPPEENIPEKTEKGVWRFEPGVHNVGLLEVPDSVRHIHIAGGAFVSGAFSNKNKASNFKITGRGILSARDLDEKSLRIIKLSGEGLNVYVEGITLLNGKTGGVEINQNYSTIRNCKIFGWQAKTDGVECGEHALIEDCFFRCNGDALKAYGNYLLAQKCVFWQNESGAVFQLAWNLNRDGHNFRISDCDVVYCERNGDADEAAIFSSVHSGPGNLSNYLFEDIRIEGDVFRLFKLTIRTSAYDDDPYYGSISNIHFKDIKLEGECLMANEIWGYNQQHNINDVVFENILIDGKKITNEIDGNFKINRNTATGVIFK